MIVGAALAACGSEPIVTDATVEIPEGGYDLTEDSLRSQLGSEPIDDIDWQRSITGADGVGLAVVGSGTVPDAAELDLIAATVADIPSALWNQTDLRTIVRTVRAPGQRAPHAQPIAYALGPDVYLLDEALSLSDGGSTRYELARALVHELVHVAQFTTMSDEYVAAALDGRIDTVDPTLGSELVADFAASTGWTRANPAAEAPFGPGAGWELALDVTASSEYGRTNPAEDMAEATTLVLMGRDDLVPADRVAWVETWLGESIDRLAAGRPWVPQGSAEVLSNDPLYDQDAVAALSGDRSHVEPSYFELPTDLGDAGTIAATVTEHLLGRGVVGTMEPIDDPRVPRLGGRFTGQHGIVWWVELWDFRLRADGTSGPSAPVLVYVAVW